MPFEITSIAPPAKPRPGFRFTVEGQIWLGFAFTLALIGWYKTINIILLVAYLMVGLVIVNALLAWRHARSGRAVRLPLEPVYANEPAFASVHVANGSPRAGTLEVLDTIGPVTTGWLVHNMPPGFEAMLRESRRFPGRGRYACEPVLVTSAFPFGFVRFAVEMANEPRQDAIVLPACGRINLEGLWRWMTTHGGSNGRLRRPLRRITSDQADVRGVRPFRSGDSLRWIHWRTTAKHGEPMVREYDVPPSPSLVLVLDPWLPTEATDRDRRNLEAALSLAATLAVAICSDESSDLTLYVPGLAKPARLAKGSESSLRNVLIALADVKGGDAVATPLLKDRSTTSAARLVVSTRPQSPLVDGLARSTGRPFLSIDASSPPPWYLSPANTNR